MDRTIAVLPANRGSLASGRGIFSFLCNKKKEEKPARRLALLMSKTAAFFQDRKSAGRPLSYSGTLAIEWHK